MKGLPRTRGYRWSAASFGFVSAEERQQADLFFADLAGLPQSRAGLYRRRELLDAAREFVEDAAEDRAVVDIRSRAIESARARRTFLDEVAITRAIDDRTSRPELSQLFDAGVAAAVPYRRRADARGTDMTAQLTLYWGVVDVGAARILALLERDRFRCASASALVVHADVIDAMRAAWTQTGETLTVGALCRGPAPAICPASHASLHSPSGSTGSDAAHFTDLDRGRIRTVEIAGLFGVDLRRVTSGARPSTAVKTVSAAAPFQPVSFVGIRKGDRREIHVAREAPRRVESWVDGQPWLCLPFVPGLSYRLFKRRFWEASFHRQWGTSPSISWIAGLTNFYRDNAGLPMGVGDISHVVGEEITDHASHRVGKDVDCYVLEAPPDGSQFPVGFWCTGTRASLELRELVAPDAGAARPEYGVPTGTPIADPRRTTLLDRYATILAYCVATQTALQAAVWHGGPGLAARAVAIALDAWDRTVAANAGTTQRPGWRTKWGPGPASRAAIDAPPASLFIGDGSAAYGLGRGWPPHQDHIHVRLK
jgi:hypothetical protein